VIFEFMEICMNISVLKVQENNTMVLLIVVISELMDFVDRLKYF